MRCVLEVSFVSPCIMNNFWQTLSSVWCWTWFCIYIICSWCGAQTIYSAILLLRSTSSSDFWWCPWYLIYDKSYITILLWLIFLDSLLFSFAFHWFLCNHIISAYSPFGIYNLLHNQFVVVSHEPANLQPVSATKKTDSFHW